MTKPVLQKQKRLHKRLFVFLFVTGILFVGGLLFKPNTVFAAVDPNSAAVIAAKQTEVVACNIPIAALVLGTGPITNPNGCKAVSESLKTTNDTVTKPTLQLLMVEALLKLEGFVLNRLAYEAAMALANGGPGQDSLFYKKSAGEGALAVGELVAGEAIGDLNDAIARGTNIKYNLCVPTSPIIRLNLQIGIKQQYRPVAPKCDFDNLTKNWESVWADAKNTFGGADEVNRFLLDQAQKAMRPNSNELGASIQFNFITNDKAHEAGSILSDEQLGNKGYKAVKDLVTGTIMTPADQVEKNFTQKLQAMEGSGTKIEPKDILSAGDVQLSLLFTAGQTFTNTLSSQLFNKVYKGLFQASPENFDPFNTEMTSLGNDVAANQKSLSGIFTASPISVSQYDVLASFVSCLDENIANRTIDSCVINDQFLSVLTRGTSNPLTVKEAIDGKLINGDWPLISDQDTQKNNDRNCRTYGFCYGNLVKMRKARIVPVGWEMAAHKNSVDHPQSLKQVMNAFNDCNGKGLLDAQHPWCHLIDPNWVLKAPESQCRATVNGEIRNSLNLAGRQTYCADAPTCIGEDNNGNCVNGFGYCVEEKNIWRIKGDECPSYYATCLSLKDTSNGNQSNLLLNTIDRSVCSKQNAGCAWYKTQKHVDDNGTQSDKKDDTFKWLAGDETYNVADRGDDLSYQIAGNNVNPRATYDYNTFDKKTGAKIAALSYSSYSFEDRLYLTHAAKTCTQDQAGCTELNVQNGSIALNLIQNGSFESHKDNDPLPDNWQITDLNGNGISKGIAATKDDSAFDGSNSVSPIDDNRVSQTVTVTPGSFYTLSLYAASDINNTSYVAIQPLTINGDVIDLSGLTYSKETCSLFQDKNKYYIGTNNLSSIAKEDGWKRLSCTFSLPSTATQIKIVVYNQKLVNSTTSIRYDGVQLEAGENATGFSENGYNTSTLTKSYLKLAPAYLGCKGLPTDSQECKSFAPVCQAQDVGCNLYTPAGTGPNVPAITSALDSCPAECVGYDTFKQEATLYESSNFPQYFIADKSAFCSEQAVGCDGFTKLGSVQGGGEQQRYFTGLRSCLTTTMADSASAGKIPATYFTWEGSDNTGYQLQTWSLLQSNVNVGVLDFAAAPNGSGFKETKPGLAPCTKVQNLDESTVVCADDQTDGQAPNLTPHLTTISNDSVCDEHTDIITNPDCREFFDSAGNIHYRRYSQTVSIDNACESFRKDKSTKENCDNSGGFWITQGFCRYFGLEKESNKCSVTENGCRAYTGGAGRNANVILNETFENGISSWQIWKGKGGPVSMMSPSNDSVSATGHSLAFKDTDATNRGISTTQRYLNGVSTAMKYDDSTDATKAASCTAVGGNVTANGCAFAECTVQKGASSCGALVGKLKQGKVYTVQFWAKGTGNLYVGFQDKGGVSTLYDFVDTTNKQTNQLSGALKLDPNWHIYNIGPIDTSDKQRFANFDDNTVLTFFTDNSNAFNIDNIQLTQTADKLTVIKDSWVTPASCDQTPDGISAPQHFLGCKAYTDQNQNAGSYYQFSHVCSEQAVGCSAFYNTFNSDSAYGEVHNARCINGGATNDFTNGVEVASPADCSVNGVSYCTIPFGQSYCVFTSNHTFPNPLPNDPTKHFAIVYGPEAVVTSQDQPVFVIDNKSNVCSDSFKGCREVGKPTYAQDLKTVTGFDSVYVMDSPKDYSNILCENNALFCEEYSSNKDGNFYFKNPQKKICEYKNSVVFNGKTMNGWFRAGTNEPCYWTDVAVDGKFDGKYDPEVDSAYLTAGERSEIWKNGDTKIVNGVETHYDGWVGQCDTGSDRCSNLLDVTDTSVENHGAGKSYYVINNDKLENKSVANTDQCNGRVSQKNGCALFDITTNSELKYNASASYVLSMHADVLLVGKPNDLVDPIDCNQANAGKFPTDPDKHPISDVVKSQIGLSGSSVDLCARRCQYQTGSSDPLLSPYAKVSGSVTDERSCFQNSDCPVLGTSLNATPHLHGTCQNMDSEDFRLGNDTNMVLKVARDRTCSEWLSCSSGRTSWDPNNNKYVQICDAVNLCSEGKTEGGQSQCTSWATRPAVIFSPLEYSSRDVSWAGREYAGFEIPNQLPVEKYSQVDMNANKKIKLCVYTQGALDAVKEGLIENKISIVCTTDTECDTEYGVGLATCVEQPTDVAPDYRLVFNAGACSEDEVKNPIADGVQCTIGICSESKRTCISNKECVGGAKDICATGSCENVSAVSCKVKPTDTTTFSKDCNVPGKEAKDADGNPTPICDINASVCVATTSTACLMSNPVTCKATGSKCVPTTTTTFGYCHNNRCLTDIRDTDGDGIAEPLQPQSDDHQSCRGFPETDSPFPNKVVVADQWKNGPKGSGKDPFAKNNPDLIKDAIATSADPDKSFGAPVTPWAEPFKFVTGYKDSKVCSPDPVTGKVTDDCLCTYVKVEYGKGIETRYYKQNQSDVPSGVCTTGLLKGVECATDLSCTIKAGAIDSASDPKKPASDIPGTCTMKTADNTVYGWPGYCLEKDTSIHLNASTDPKDQACLTWLPVDQLSGSTDLYGKDTSAGYKLESTSYCAEVSAAYDVGISKVACALTNSGSGCNQSGDWDKDHSAYYDNSVYCPTNYFAIMGLCGDRDQSKQCGKSGFFGYFTNDNAPYFCVPKFSFHTDEKNLYTGTDLRGQKCLAPGVSEGGSTSVFSQATHICLDGAKKAADCGKPNDQFKEGSFSFSSSRPGVTTSVHVYSFFTDVQNFYSDCKVKGVTEEKLSTFSSPKSKFSDILAADNDFGFNDGYYGLRFNVAQYPVCSSIVEVAKDKNAKASVSNVAWTDRLWSASTANPKFAIKDSLSNLFGLFESSLAAPFGVFTKNSTKIEDIDPAPFKASACKATVSDTINYKNPNVDLSCSGDGFEIDKSYGADKGENARAYQKFSVSFSPNDVDSNYCAKYDSVKKICEVNTLTFFKTTMEEECNWDKKNIWKKDYTDDYFDGTKTTDGTPIYCNYHCVGGVDKDKVSLDGKPCTGSNNECGTPESKGYCTGGKSYCIDKTDSAFQNCVTAAPLGEEQNCKGKLIECTNETPQWKDNTCGFGKDSCQPPSKLCIGGPKNGNTCGGVDICRPNLVHKEVLNNFCYKNGAVQSLTPEPNGQANAISRLQQIFAESFVLNKFHDTNYGALDTYGYGQYALEQNLGSWAWDARAKGDNKNQADSIPTPPKVKSVGSCIGTSCMENKEGRISVNGKDNGEILGVGSVHANATFYVYANKNQMPLRKIVIDWGDVMDPTQWGDKAWPFHGSNSSDKDYYKNRRGLDPKPPHNSFCDPMAVEKDKNGNDLVDKDGNKILMGFGGSADGCRSEYAYFYKDYTCTQGDLKNLKGAGRLCAQPGTPQFSPCYEPDGTPQGGFCVFIPRVYAEDNWGWCTGKCTANTSDGTDGCFSGDANDPKNECDFQHCPGDSCAATKIKGTANPWIDYAGQIKIKPE